MRDSYSRPSCSVLALADSKSGGADLAFNTATTTVDHHSTRSTTSTTAMNDCTACRDRRWSNGLVPSTTIDRRYSAMEDLEASGSHRWSIRVRPSPRSSTLPIFIVLVALIALYSLPTADGCFPGGRLIRRLPKNEPPFVFKQHVPNLPENSPAASGPREGRIKRMTKRYKELVMNYNPDIVFKDEEGTGEDRIMSVRCKEKLDALAMLVMNYWRDTVKVRVVEAWDTQGHHADNSLHYEGRAVDLTTSDLDKSKYAQLARLAVQAGFDFVYFESRTHVHASVKSDAVTRHKRVLKCFPANSTVLIDSGVRKPMSELNVGDRVAVVSNRRSDERPIFEPVIAFLHRDTTAKSEYLRVRTASGRVLTASADHLIYRTSTNGGGAISVKATTRLDADDVLLVDTASNGSSVGRDTVISVDLVEAEGLYAPLTASGTLFVDDVLVSCYAGVNDERLAHEVMAPLRFWHRIWNRGHHRRTAASANDGVHWYAELLWTVAEYLERWGLAKIIDDV